MSTLRAAAPQIENSSPDRTQAAKKVAGVHAGPRGHKQLRRPAGRRVRRHWPRAQSSCSIDAPGHPLTLLAAVASRRRDRATDRCHATSVPERARQGGRITGTEGPVTHQPSWTAIGGGNTRDDLLSSESAPADSVSACPLRARCIGRTWCFTVTGGAAKVHADLWRDWSGLSPALIPKLIVRVRFSSPGLVKTVDAGADGA